MSEKHADVLVVGAGIAGLMAAYPLQKIGLNVVVVDMETTVGGRLATRTVGSGRADLGAQFFTVRTDEFRNWVDQWQYEKIVYLWSMGFSDGSLHRPIGDGHPRYAVHGGMAELAKHLAHDLDHVHTGVQIVTATASGDGWLVQDAEGELFTSSALLLTPPVPQSLELLRAGATRLSDDDYAALTKIEYTPCLSGMFWVEGPLHLPEHGAVHLHEGPISWIADNKQKGISREATILTVHASSEYSQQLWLVKDGEILDALRASIKPYIETKTVIREAQLYRWRYSLPTTLHSEPYLLAEGLPLLVFAGDGFSHPRVEGAALSGLAAGRALLAGMKKK